MARRSAYSKTLPSQHSELSPTKARKILHDKEVRGHPLTERQRRFMGAVASRGKRGR